MKTVRWWHKQSDMATCREVGRVLQTYLDSELADEAKIQRVAAHLEACRRCGLEADTYKAIKSALHRVGASPQDEAISRLSAFAEQLSEVSDGE